MSYSNLLSPCDTWLLKQFDKLHEGWFGSFVDLTVHKTLKKCTWWRMGTRDCWWTQSSLGFYLHASDDSHTCALKMRKKWWWDFFIKHSLTESAFAFRGTVIKIRCCYQLTSKSSSKTCWLENSGRLSLMSSMSLWRTDFDSETYEQPFKNLEIVITSKGIVTSKCFCILPKMGWF